MSIEKVLQIDNTINLKLTLVDNNDIIKNRVKILLQNFK